MMFFTWGSSPLTRGKLNATGPALTGTGLIPAHAGKTTSYAGNLTVFRAHPRSRGENLRTGSPCAERGGSSPLTRGKLRVTGLFDKTHGLIPAHAGKTSRQHTASRRCWAHPRSRGENVEDGVSVLEGEGSSPLTRGKPALG